MRIEAKINETIKMGYTLNESAELQKSPLQWQLIIFLSSVSVQPILLEPPAHPFCVSKEIQYRKSLHSLSFDLCITNQ